MRHPSICPIKSPGPTIAERTPERIGQTTRISRKSSMKKMRLICLDRISLQPSPQFLCERQHEARPPFEQARSTLFRCPKCGAAAEDPSADCAVYAFSTNLQRRKGIRRET